MKNATLLALGLLAAGVWSQDSARCQTSLSPPLSLAPPPPDERSASPGATNSVWPPTATAKSSVPPRAAEDSLPRSTAPRSATVEHTPVESGSASPAQVIDRSPPSARPVPDYDGFSVGIDDDTSSRTTRPVRSHRAKQPKLDQEADRVSRQQSVDPGDDDKLKGKLTICRGCK
ncbi:hypothetical protein BSN85_02560 [Bradyrhizobium brasilense]|nr:hypothetical protein BSN85_02560 [Bradyrhizobium brasilense]